jgi:hypothetical protein
VPSDECEDVPSSVRVGEDVFGDICSALLLFRTSEDTWRNVTRPDLGVYGGGVAIPAGEVVFLLTERGYGRDAEPRAFVYRPTFACGGLSGRSPGAARALAQLFLYLRDAEAELDIGEILAQSGLDRYATGGGGLGPLLGHIPVAEVLSVDGPLSADGRYEVGVRLLVGYEEVAVEETLLVSPGGNLHGERCDLLVVGARTDGTGP